jgi:hypothetical protein
MVVNRHSGYLEGGPARNVIVSPRIVSTLMATTGPSSARRRIGTSRSSAIIVVVGPPAGAMSAAKAGIESNATSDAANAERMILDRT